MPSVKNSNKSKQRKAPPKALNMGLGKLKGVFQERKSRLDAEIDRQSGNGKPKKK